MRLPAVGALLVAAAVVSGACGVSAGRPAVSGSVDFRTATPSPSLTVGLPVFDGASVSIVPTPGATPTVPVPGFAEARLEAANEIGDVSTLTEGELRLILAAAGWEPQLYDAGVRLARCESRLRPGATNGRYRGLYQLEAGTWDRYAGVSEDALLDAAVNARVAWLAVLYDRAHGRPDFAQWECQP